MREEAPEICLRLRASDGPLRRPTGYVSRAYETAK